MTWRETCEHLLRAESLLSTIGYSALQAIISNSHYVLCYSISRQSEAEVHYSFMQH